MRTIKPVARLLCCSALLIILAASCLGADLTLSVLNPNRIGFPGESFVFQGTITNDTVVTLDQNTLFLNFSGYDSGNLTITELLPLNLFSIDPGQTSATIDLFKVDLSAAAPLGTYLFDIFVQDDATAFSDSVTGSITATAVPEPGSLALVTAGLLLALVRQSRKGGAS